MSNCKVEKIENEIYLSGNLTIQNSAKLKDELLKISNSDLIKIKIDKDAIVDLSTIQLLISLRKSAKQKGKKFSLNTDNDSYLLVILEKYGLNQLENGTEIPEAEFNS